MTDEILQENAQLNTTVKEMTQNTRKLSWFSRHLLNYQYTRPGNEVGLFYNAPEPTCVVVLQWRVSVVIRLSVIITCFTFRLLKFANCSVPPFLPLPPL